MNKKNFVAYIMVKGANPNGDPLNENVPREMNGLGYITDECIKRKIRNRMQDILGTGKVFLQSEDRTDDGFMYLKDRAKELLEESNSPQETYDKACEKWIDVRALGQLFTEKQPASIRGAVTIMPIFSCDPIDTQYVQITKSASYDPATKGSDTMGGKYIVPFGLYKVAGSVNSYLAEKNGFTEDDAEVLKRAIATLFVNDESSARPDGSMSIVKMYWFNHNCKEGQYSSDKVHNFVNAKLKDGIVEPTKLEDYEFIENIPSDIDYEEIENTL